VVAADARRRVAAAALLRPRPAGDVGRRVQRLLRPPSTPEVGEGVVSRDRDGAARRQRDDGADDFRDEVRTPLRRRRVRIDDDDETHEGIPRLRQTSRRRPEHLLTAEIVEKKS